MNQEESQPASHRDPAHEVSYTCMSYGNFRLSQSHPKVHLDSSVSSLLDPNQAILLS